MKIKKLPLEFPFDRPKTGWISWGDCVKEEDRITPIFNKNGYYLDRETNITWLEINGEAWKYQTREAFEYRLRTSEFEELYDDVYKALQTLSKSSLLTKKQRQILYFQQNIRTSRQVSISAKKAGLGFKKKFEKFGEKMSFTYEYERPALTVDIVLFDRNPEYDQDNETEVLLVKRKNDPFRGSWVFPGGFVEYGERTLEAAFRELKEETSIERRYLSFVGIFDDPNRDPRGWVVSIAYTGIISEHEKRIIKAGDDAAECRWVNLQEIDNKKYILGFDHFNILSSAITNYWLD